MTTPHTSGAADLHDALRIEDALNQADRAEAAALSYGEGTTLGIEAYAAAKTIRALHSKLAALAVGQAVAPAEALQWTIDTPPTTDVCHYDHCTAKSPLGDFRIEWKSWKQHDARCLYLNGEYICGAGTTEAAKKMAQDHIESVAAALEPYRAARPAPPAMDGAWKDHNTAQLVNELRDVAVQFHGAQQLRERIAHVIVPLTEKLKAAMDGGAEDAARWKHVEQSDDFAVCRLDDGAWREVFAPDDVIDAARAAQKEAAP